MVVVFFDYATYNERSYYMTSVIFGSLSGWKSLRFDRPRHIWQRAITE